MKRVLLLALMWLCACGSVPELHFVSAEAGAPDASSGTNDAATPDTGGGNVLNDIGSCSGGRPDGARCCGGVWCIGQCDDANCELCSQRCAEQDTLCCGKSGTALCKGKCP